jgi:hypothetical protein
LASITRVDTHYADLVLPFIICGIGMTLFFVPLASLVLGAVPKALEGVASGANSAFRELGGVLGIAVLGAVFSSNGGYASGQDYVNGMTPAVYGGAVVVAIGVVAALLVPGRRRARAELASYGGAGYGIEDLIAPSRGVADGTGADGVVAGIDPALGSRGRRSVPVG